MFTWFTCKLMKAIVDHEKPGLSDRSWIAYVCVLAAATHWTPFRRMWTVDEKRAELDSNICNARSGLDEMGHRPWQSRLGV